MSGGPAITACTAASPLKGDSRAPARRTPPHSSASSWVRLCGGRNYGEYIFFARAGVNGGRRGKRPPPRTHARRRHTLPACSAPPSTYIHVRTCIVSVLQPGEPHASHRWPTSTARVDFLFYPSTLRTGDRPPYQPPLRA